MALGEPGAGEYILITNYSKDAIGAILHQVQHGSLGQKEKNAGPMKKNIIAVRGKLLALDYGFKKLNRFLHQGPFTVRSDNSTVLHWENMKADEKVLVSPCVKKNGWKTLLCSTYWYTCHKCRL